MASLPITAASTDVSIVTDNFDIIMGQVTDMSQTKETQHRGITSRASG